MKKIIFLVLIAIGGFSMTEIEVKKKVFEDASNQKADATISEAQEIIKNRLVNKYKINQNTIINWAIEYSSYPENPYSGNKLDYELRRVANLKSQYFQPYDFKAAGKELKEMEKQMNPGVLSWLKYIGIGLGVLLVGSLAFRYLKK